MTVTSNHHGILLIPNSLVKPLSQTASFLASASVVYSASVVDNAIINCAVALQLIGPPPQTKT